MKLALVILAAGLSKRMGVLKALLPIGNRSAVLRCVDTAHSCGVDDVYVVTGYRRELVEGAVSGLGSRVRTVYNKDYETGMYSSIIAGAEAVREGYDGVLLLPVDCAAVSRATVTALIRAFRERKGEVLIRPKIGDKRGHPPVIPQKLMAKLLNYDGSDGMRGFLNTCPFEILKTEDKGIILDMDTPQDYAELLEYLGLPAYPNREESGALFKKYKTPENIIAHGGHVASVALKIAEILSDTGVKSDTALLESASVLHDISREKNNHEYEGFKLLLKEGYPKAAMIVRSHMNPPDKPFERVGESEILYLADKYCRGGKFVPLDVTMGKLAEKFADNPETREKACARMAYAMKIESSIIKGCGEFSDILCNNLRFC